MVGELADRLATRGHPGKPGTHHFRSDWPGLADLLHSLRIDPEGLAALRAGDLDALKPVYRHRRLRTLIDAMQRELTS